MKVCPKSVFNDYKWYWQAIENYEDLAQLDGAILANQETAELNGYTPSLNDIRIIHHPSAEREQDVYSFDIYCSGGESNPTEDHLRRFAHMDHTSTDRPWRPFASRIDFELAEVILDAHMNGPQVERIFDILHRVNIENLRPIDTNRASSTHLSESLTLRSRSDLAQIWDLARQTRATGVHFGPLHISDLI